MNRRQLLAGLAAGGVLTASGLWMPGKKLISIPSGKQYRALISSIWLEYGPIDHWQETTHYTDGTTRVRRFPLNALEQDDDE